MGGEVSLCVETGVGRRKALVCDLAGIQLPGAWNVDVPLSWIKVVV